MRAKSPAVATLVISLLTIAAPAVSLLTMTSSRPGNAQADNQVVVATTEEGAQVALPSDLAAALILPH